MEEVGFGHVYDESIELRLDTENFLLWVTSVGPMRVRMDTPAAFSLHGELHVGITPQQGNARLCGLQLHTGTLEELQAEKGGRKKRRKKRGDEGRRSKNDSQGFSGYFSSSFIACALGAVGLGTVKVVEKRLEAKKDASRRRDASRKMRDGNVAASKSELSRRNNSSNAPQQPAPCHSSKLRNRPNPLPPARVAKRELTVEERARRAEKEAAKGKLREKAREQSKREEAKALATALAAAESAARRSAAALAALSAEEEAERAEAAEQEAAVLRKRAADAADAEATRAKAASMVANRKARARTKPKRRAPPASVAEAPAERAIAAHNTVQSEPAATTREDLSSMPGSDVLSQLWTGGSIFDNTYLGGTAVPEPDDPESSESAESLDRLGILGILADIEDDDNTDTIQPNLGATTNWNGPSANVGEPRADTQLDSPSAFTAWLAERDFAENWAGLVQGGVQTLRQLASVELNEQKLLSLGFATMPSRIRFRSEVKAWNEANAAYSYAGGSVSGDLHADVSTGNAPAVEDVEPDEWFWQQPLSTVEEVAAKSQSRFFQW